MYACSHTSLLPPFHCLPTPPAQQYIVQYGPAHLGHTPMPHLLLLGEGAGRGQHLIHCLLELLLIALGPGLGNLVLVLDLQLM